MRIFLGLVVLILGVAEASMDSSFNEGTQHAAAMSGGIEDNIKSGKDQTEVPQFQGVIHIDKENVSNQAEEYLKHDKYGQDLKEIHTTRKIYIVDDTDPMIMRSENINKDPKTALDEAEEVIESKDGETIETCEDCPDEEYLVTAIRSKMNLVYMTASKRCDTPDHGLLVIRIELTDIADGLLERGGPYNNVCFIGRSHDGPYIYETYNVEGYNVTLRKTIHQEDRPGIQPRCYLVPALTQYVLNPKDLINNLLGLNMSPHVWWGDIGMAQLNTIGNQFYFINDVQAVTYEKLVQQGLCRYVSAEDISRNHRSVTQKLTYSCRLNCKDTCKMLRARGCSREPDPECLQKIGDKCVRWRWKFRCKDRIGVKKHKFSKENAFCLGGECIDSAYESDKDMVQALGYLSILEASRKDMIVDGENIEIFKGNPMGCVRHCFGFSDCCKCGSNGWGVSIGLTNCSDHEKTLAQLRGENKCVLVGTYCVEKESITRTCIRKKTVFCCFESKFAKLLQEQGKPQLGQNFGSPESPNCRGFTAEELGRIDFSKLDLSDIVNDVVDNFKAPSQEHFAKGEELEHIQEQMKKKIQEQIPAGAERESVFLKENLRHMTSSMKEDK